MKLRLALAQIPSSLGDVINNKEKHISVLKELTEYRPDIVCFPELSLTGYMIKDLAYELPIPCLQAVNKIAKIVGPNQRVVVGGVAYNEFKFVQNVGFVVGSNKIIGVVKKFYLPTYGLFEEMRYFTPGNPQSDIQCFEASSIKFGVVICEDAWHPEPIECLARLGAQIVFCLASSPVRGLNVKEASKALPIEDQWLSLLKAHALMNTVFIAFVNRVGPEDEECFWGGSALISPRGNIIHRAKKFKPEIITAEIDIEEVTRARRFSSFRDHKKDFHEVLSSI